MMNECTRDDARDHGTHFNLKFDFNLIEIEICFRNEIEICAIVYRDPLHSSGSFSVSFENKNKIHPFKKQLLK